MTAYWMPGNTALPSIPVKMESNVNPTYVRRQARWYGTTGNGCNSNLSEAPNLPCSAPTSLSEVSPGWAGHCGAKRRLENCMKMTYLAEQSNTHELERTSPVDDDLRWRGRGDLRVLPRQRRFRGLLHRLHLWLRRRAGGWRHVLAGVVDGVVVRGGGKGVSARRGRHGCIEV